MDWEPTGTFSSSFRLLEAKEMGELASWGFASWLGELGQEERPLDVGRRYLVVLHISGELGHDPKLGGAAAEPPSGVHIETGLLSREKDIRTKSRIDTDV